MPILTSSFETDFYKLPMQEVAMLQFPDIFTRYELILRKPIQFPPGFAERLKEEVEAMADLAPTKLEMDYLRTHADFLKPIYLEWRSQYRFNPDEVYIFQRGGELAVIIEGLWYRTMPWETPLMAIICQLYYEMMGLTPKRGWSMIARGSAETLYREGVNWSDFGFRRAFSRQIHESVLVEAMDFRQRDNIPGGLVGTSCVSLAVKHGIKMNGTIAHEKGMVLGAGFGYPIANQMVLDAWMHEFKGRLGTALPDTYTTEVFLRDFTHEHAKAYDGLRVDSGNPFERAELLIAHYKSLGIDPMSKTLIFSDRLNVEKMIQLKKFCEGKIKCSFGWGTGFTNNVGHPSLDIVIKATAVKINERHPWLPAVKLSDDPNKATNEPVAKAVRLLLGI